MSHIVLINPRFDVSYWGLEYALPIFARRANVPPICLPLLAALTPREHEMTLVDENVEPLDFDRLAQADVVGLTGMGVQRHRMREILAELKRRGAFSVVGGPWVTVKEDYFGDLADVIFVGEAEETWPRFLAEWRQAARPALRARAAHRYGPPAGAALRTAQNGALPVWQRTVHARLPLPVRILRHHRHLRPAAAAEDRGTGACRARGPAGAGMRMAFLVDDNLIGNKRAIRPILAAVADWQRAHGYSLVLLTQVSIDLAEDADLMRMMEEANIAIVFIGIETPSEASLRETKKLQNVRKGGTLLERTRTIQNAGFEVWCGMILGFDHDDPSVFEAQRQFLAETHIMHAMVGMLVAVPKTPLYARLASEGRLDLDDVPEFGTNVVPAGMTRGELRDGYVQLMQELYAPKRTSPPLRKSTIAATSSPTAPVPAIGGGIPGCG